jgi:hypothetical protein
MSWTAVFRTTSTKIQLERELEIGIPHIILEGIYEPLSGRNQQESALQLYLYWQRF